MYEEIRQWLEKKLSHKRYMHSLGSEQTARELAEKFCADPDRAALAALLHDNAKKLSDEELLDIIKNNDLNLSQEEMRSIKILHSPVGAFIAEKDLGIKDREVLDAIRYHTVGKSDMTPLQKIVFIADKIEPNTRDVEFRDKILQKLNETKNLDEGLLICCAATIKSLVKRKMVINKQTIEIWNDLVKKLQN